jgi:hypothetical protein
MAVRALRSAFRLRQRQQSLRSLHRSQGVWLVIGKKGASYKGRVRFPFKGGGYKLIRPAAALLVELLHYSI